MLEHVTRMSVELAARSTSLQVFEATALIIIDIAAFFGNLLVCRALWQNPRLRTIPNMFVTSLAISDILMSGTVMPFAIGILISGRWIYAESLCYVMGYTEFVLAMVSLHTLTLIAINRFFAICKPHKYRNIFTRKNTKILLAIVWASPLIFASPPLWVQKGRFAYHPGKAFCMYPFEANLGYTLALEIIFIGTPLNIIMGCYQKVFSVVKQNQSRVANMRAGSENNPGLATHVEEVKITLSLVCVMVGFMICWLPVSIIDFIDLGYGEPTLARQVYLLYMMLVFLSSSLNPFIYGVFNKQIQAEYKKIFRCGRRSNAVTGGREGITGRDTGTTGTATQNETTGVM